MGTTTGVSSIIFLYLIIAVVTIGLFLLLREFFCWYYKINDMKKIMEEQRDLLRRLVEKEQLKQ